MNLFALRLARRHLLGGRHGAYLRGVAALAVAAVALGVAAVVVVVSVMDGFRVEVERALLVATPHVRVRAWSGPLAEAAPAVEAVRALEGVAAAGPFVAGHALVRGEVGEAIPIEVVGIEAADQVVDVPSRIEEGAWATAETAVHVGREFALAHGVRPGDRLTIVSPEGGAAGVEVAGLFSTGFYEIDYGRFYASLAGARRALGRRAGADGIDVRCASAGEADRVAADVARLEVEVDGETVPLDALPWTKARRNLLKAMRIEKAAMFVIESFVVLVAAFNIASLLTMVVTRKTREVGVLAALGATRGQIVAAFALQGIALGALGAGLGAAGGLAISAALRRWPIRLPGGGDVYVLEYVPVAVSAETVAVSAGVAVAAALLAALYPARAAARLDPVQALRAE